MPFWKKAEIDRPTEATVTDPVPAEVPVAETTPVIDASMHVKGDIAADSDLRLEGTVAGDVTADGHVLTIGRDARVIGTVRAGSVVVHGEIRGSVSATDKLEVASTAVVKGFIHATRLVLADGGVLWGTVNGERDPGPASDADDTLDLVKEALNAIHACG